MLKLVRGSKQNFVIFAALKIKRPYSSMDTCLPAGREYKISVMENFWVYALKSELDDRIYVGFSSNVAKRLIEHNSGKTKSTKGFLPWKLIFKEKVENRIQARKLEKYYKSGIGKEKLKQL